MTTSEKIEHEFKFDAHRLTALHKRELEGCNTTVDIASNAMHNLAVAVVQLHMIGITHEQLNRIVDDFIQTSETMELLKSSHGGSV